MANNPSLTIRIGADASGAIQNLNQTTNHVRNLGSQVNNTTNHFNHYNTTINQASNATTGLDNRIRGLSGSFGLLNAAISGISFGAAIKEIATFETKMLGLKALTMANSQEMAQMEKQARSLGATTAFSAQEAAQAQSVLASAGLKTNEILTATPKILQLAAAGTLELSKAAEISVAAMHGMGLELKDLGHINDVLVQAASDYTINVEQLGHAFGETAVVAHTYGVSLEATASSLGILKENGMAAGSIGDALKSLFGALVNDTKQNTEVLGRYTAGLDHHKMSYKDLNVETLGYTKVLQNLKDAHIGATDMTKLFGETASTAAILLSEHISKIKDNESAYIKLNGAAERQSDILNQGLSKAWDALKGSLSEAALQLGDSGLKGALTGIIQQATGVISIYEGMGDSFRKSNKLADDQFQKLKEIANQLNVVAGAATGIGVLTAALWAGNRAAVAFNATLLLISRHPIMAIAGAGMALYGANKSALSNAMSDADSQIAYYENRVNKYKDKSVLFRPIDFDLQKESAALSALKQATQEKADFLKNQASHSASIQGIVDETEQWYALADTVKKTNKVVTSNNDDLEKSTKTQTEAQRAAQKEQEGYKRLIESTPIGEYRSKMDELSNALKKGGIDQQTYNDLTVEAASKFEKATVDLNAYNQALADHKKRLESVSDYNATIDELGRNKQRGAITKGEYSLGVSQANAGLMNQVTDKQIPVDRASEVIDAKNINESEKALTKFNDETQKTIDSFHQLHDSGSMAFDGILGGISAVAGAATSFSDVMSKLNENQSAYAKSYNDFMKDSTKTEADKAEATKQFAQESAAYNSAKTQAEISGARQIAGATSKMFSEKSTARKAFHGIEMGLAVIEMAMSAKKMVVDLAAGAAAMFGQSGWAGFAGVAAMMAVMASLGVAMGASDKVTDLSTPETKTTGSVLGDSEKASTSIKSITDTLNGIHAEEYRELKGINSNFKELVQMTTTGTAKALQDRGAFSFSTKGMSGQSSNTGASEKQFLMGLGTTAISAGMAAAGVGTGLATGALAGAIGAISGVSTGLSGALVGLSASIMSGGLAAAAAMGGVGLLIGGAIYGLSKLLGIGKVKFEAVGGGIIMNAQKFILDGADKAAQQVTVFDYSKIKKTVTGWFSDDVTYFDVINRVDNPLTKLFTGIFHNVKLNLIAASTDVFKDSELFNTDVTLPKIKLALKAGEKYTAENQKKIEDAINKGSDDIAGQAFGRYLAQFQQMGEGLYETTIRLASQATVATSGMEKLGLKTNLTGLGLISFGDSLTRAFGGLKELKSGLEDLYNLFTSDDQKLIDAKKAVNDFMATLSIPKGSNVPTTIKSDADAKSITNYLASEVAKVSSVLDVFKKTTNTKPEEAGIAKLETSLANTLPKDDKAYLKQFDVTEITTDVLKEALKGTKYSLAGEIEGTKALGKSYQPLIDYAAANQKYLASSSVFNNAKYDQTLVENLSKLGFTMPDTIDGVAKFVSELDKLNDSSANNVAAFNSLSKSTKLVTSEQSKAVDELKNFKKSITDWVLNKQITQIGSPQAQFDAAKSAYESNLAILQNASASQIDRSAAMSKITGAADAYISKISEMYATGSTGQTGITGASMISGIVNQVASLGDVPDIATQQLTTLNSIDAGVSSVATAITDLSLNLPNAANDSSTKTDETIKELKQQNATLTDMVIELKALVTTQVNSNVQVQSTLTDIASQTTVTASATRLQALK